MADKGAAEIVGAVAGLAAPALRAILESGSAEDVLTTFVEAVERIERRALARVEELERRCGVAEMRVDALLSAIASENLNRARRALEEAKHGHGG